MCCRTVPCSPSRADEAITGYNEGRADRNIWTLNGLKEIRIVPSFVEEMRQRTGQ